MKPVRFAVLGTGNIAKIHAQAICSATNAELVGIWGKTPQRVNDLSREFNVEPFTDLASLLERDDLDAVTVATPSGAHLEFIESAAAAGKHVLCEKPLEITPERVDQAIAACEQHNVILACVFQARFNRHVQQIKRAMDEGRFGQLVLASMQLRWFRDQAYYDSSAWRGTWTLDGGGALMNQGIHFVDLLCYLAGDPVHVSAFTATLTHERIEVEDNAVISMQFANGGLGTIEASTSCAPGFPRILSISGEHGTAVIEDDRLVQWKFTKETEEDERIRQHGAAGDQLHGGAANPTDIGHEGHRRHVEDLANAIRQKSQPLISGREARRSVALITAAYQSAKAGQPVKLPQPHHAEKP